MRVLGTYYGATLLNENTLEETNMKNKIELEYYATEKSVCIKSKKEIYYGISIVKKEYCKSNIKFEKYTVEKISTNKRRFKDIMKILKSCKVTPIALEDVLNDLMKQNMCKIAC